MGGGTGEQPADSAMLRWLRGLWERFSLRVKLPLLFLVSLLAATMYSAWYGFTVNRAMVLHTVDHRLEVCAAAAEAILPTDYHDRAVGPDAISPAEYQALARRLRNISLKSEVSYIYTLSLVNGRYRLVMSSLLDYFTPYDDVWDDLFATARDGITRISDGEDSYGPSRSIIVRRITPGGRYYYIGVDIPLSDIENMMSSQRTLFMTLGTALALLAGMVSYLLLVWITRPLKALSDFAESARKEEFALDRPLDPRLLPEGRQVGDEVMLLARSVSSMRADLADYLSRLRDTVAIRERVESEMRLAGIIQRGLLTKNTLEGTTFSVHARTSSAKVGTGDFYDFFPVGEYRLAFAIGDVSGAGMPAAMLMATALTLFRALSLNLPREALDNPEQFVLEVMRRSDDLLAEHNQERMFVTAIFGILDTRTGEICLANGGHNPPVKLERKGGGVHFVDWKPGSILGLAPDKKFVTTRLSLTPGEGLVLYTDGVIEARDARGLFFEEDMMLAAVRPMPANDNDPVAVVKTLFDAVRDFTANNPNHIADDVTVLCLRFGGKK